MLIGLDHVKEVVGKAHGEGAYRRLKGREHIAVHLRQTPIKAGTTLTIGPNKYKVEQDSYLVYVDLLHEGNFTHPVIYELHALKDGSVKTIEEKYPITDREMSRSLIPFILPPKGGQ